MQQACCLVLYAWELFQHSFFGCNWLQSSTTVTPDAGYVWVDLSKISCCSHEQHEKNGLAISNYSSSSELYVTSFCHCKLKKKTVIKLKTSTLAKFGTFVWYYFISTDFAFYLSGTPATSASRKRLYFTYRQLKITNCAIICFIAFNCHSFRL